MPDVVARPERAERPMQASQLTLHVDDQLYRGWQRVSVTRSLEQLAGTFELTLTDQWALDNQPLQLLPGQRARISIDGATVLTGWIDEVTAQLGPRQHELRVSGRDAAGDLVDCSVLDATQEILGRNLLQIAASVCAPFDIAVRTDTDIGGTFKTTHMEVGETAYELLQKLCRIRAVLCVSDGQGGIVFTRAGSEHAHGSIADNVLKGQTQRNAQDRYHTYRVLGQQRGSDTLGADPAAQSSAEATDPGITRYRPLLIQSDEPASTSECARRAQWERSVRAGRANTSRVTVRGWLDGSEPWQPNRIIHAEHRALGLHGDYLITEVNYQIDDRGGQVTELTLQPPGAYDLIPQPEADPTTGADGSLSQWQIILQGLHERGSIP